MKSKTKTTFTINNEIISQLREVSSVENISMSKLIESLISGYLMDYKNGYREYGVVGFRAEKTDVSKLKLKKESQQMKKVEQAVSIEQVQSAIDEAYIAVAAVEHKGCKKSLTNLLAFLVSANGDLSAILVMAKWIIANARLVTSTAQINNAAKAGGFVQFINLDPFQNIDMKSAYDDFQREKAKWEVQQSKANKNKLNNNN